jgi:hypothetical protein
MQPLHLVHLSRKKFKRLKMPIISESLRDNQQNVFGNEHWGSTDWSHIRSIWVAALIFQMMAAPDFPVCPATSKILRGPAVNKPFRNGSLDKTIVPEVFACSD